MATFRIQKPETAVATIRVKKTASGKVKASCDAAYTFVEYDFESGLYGTVVKAATKLIEKMNWQTYGNWNCACYYERGRPVFVYSPMPFKHNTIEVNVEEAMV